MNEFNSDLKIVNNGVSIEIFFNPDPLKQATDDRFSKKTIWFIKHLQKLLGLILDNKLNLRNTSTKNSAKLKKV